MKISIVDSGFSNLTSICNAVKAIGYKPELFDNCNNSCDVLILPGVGTFSSGIEKLKDKGIYLKIVDHYERKKPIIGICLGMQMLFESSDETPMTKGFSFMSGTIEKLSSLDNSLGRLPPNTGYSKVLFPTKKFTDEYFYFLHSFALMRYDKEFDFYGESTFNSKKFLSFFIKKNLCGTQFHPERSGKIGLSFLQMLIEHYQK